MKNLTFFKKYAGCPLLGACKCRHSRSKRSFSRFRCKNGRFFPFFFRFRIPLFLSTLPQFCEKWPPLGGQKWPPLGGVKNGNDRLRKDKHYITLGTLGSNMLCFINDLSTQGEKWPRPGTSRDHLGIIILPSWSWGMDLAHLHSYN